MERKKKLTVIRGEGGGGQCGKEGERSSWNMYKGPMDKEKVGEDQGWEVGMGRVQGLEGGNGDSCTWTAIKKMAISS